MSHKNIHQHAFWLYGVIVGLALKEALAGSGQHIISLVQNSTPAAPPLPWGPEACRIVIFLILIIRFYLGSAFYFNETYFKEDSKDDPKKVGRYYFVDFLFGLIHFLFFFGLALSIEIHGTAVNNFRLVLGFILMYDILWLVAAHYRKKILRWMVMNVLAFSLAVAVFSACRWAGIETFAAERWAFVPIGFQSFVDMAETMIGRPIVSKWIGTTANKLGRFSDWLNDA